MHPRGTLVNDTSRFSPDGKTALLTLTVGEIRNSLQLVHDGRGEPLVEEISLLGVCPCGGRNGVVGACWTGRRLVCQHCHEFPPSVHDFDRGRWTGSLSMEPTWLPLAASTSMAASPDGRLLAMTGDALRVWSLDTLQPLWTRDSSESAGHTATSPPGSVPLATSRNSRDGPESACRAAVFLPGSVTLATGHDTGEIALWAAYRGERVRVLVHPGGAPAVLGIGYSPALRALVSYHEHGHVWTWDLDTGRGHPVFQALDDTLLAFSLSPDGRYAAFSSPREGLTLWDLLQQKLTRVSVAGARPFAPKVAAFSPDSLRLFTQPGIRGSGALWAARSGHLIKDFADLSLASPEYGLPGGQAWRHPQVFSSDLAHFVVRSVDATRLAVYDTLHGRPVRCVEARPSDPEPPHFFPHPYVGVEWTDLSAPGAPLTTIVGSHGSSRVPLHLRRWEIPWRLILSRDPVGQWEDPRIPMAPLALSSDGSTGLFQVSREQRPGIEAWDLESMRCLWRHAAFEAATAGAVSPDHRLAAVGFKDGRVMLRSIPEGKFVGERTFGTHSHQLSLSADRRYLLVCLGNGVLTLWSLEDGIDLPVPPCFTWAAAFADTGTRFAALAAPYVPHLAPEDGTCWHYEIVGGEVRALASPQAVPSPSGAHRLDLWTLDWLQVPPAERGRWARKLLHLELNSDLWPLPEFVTTHGNSRFEETHDWAQAALRRLEPDRCFVPEEPWPDEVVADSVGSDGQLEFTRGHPDQDAQSSFASAWYPLSTTSQQSAGFLVCLRLPWASLLFGNATGTWRRARTVEERKVLEAARCEAQERGLFFVPLDDPLWDEPCGSRSTLLGQLVFTDWY